MCLCYSTEIGSLENNKYHLNHFLILLENIVPHFKTGNTILFPGYKPLDTALKKDFPLNILHLRNLA